MAHLVLPNLRDGYIDLCQYVTQLGERTAPRGRGTLELLGMSIEVEDLTDTLPVGIGRKLNLQIAALETLQLIGEVSRPELLFAAAPRFREFADPDGTFHGAYGERVYGQTGAVLERFRGDPESRQGVVTIWNPELDLAGPVHPDMPCTVALHLLPRGEYLHLSVYMRSNDVWLGLAYDYFVFSQWLWTVARVLGLEPGRYVHHVGSLHLYERDVEAVRQLRAPTDDEVEPVRGLNVEAYDNVAAGWQAARLRAVQLLDEPTTYTVLGTDDVWYREQSLRVHEKLEAT